MFDRLTEQEPRAQLLRFLLVGFSNFAVSFVLFHSLLALPKGLAVSPFIAQLVSYSAGTVWSFYWNRQFTFRSSGRAFGQFSRFVVLQGALAVLSAFGVAAAIERADLSPIVAWLGVMSAVTIVNFLLSRYWAFATLPRMSSTARLAAVVFTLAFAVRLALLFTVYANLQHGSASHYGSAALGLHHDAGLTINHAEVESIMRTESNVQGDFRRYFEAGERRTLTEFLPGPALLLAALWKVIPVYNFAPYLMLQVLIDSMLISVFAVLMHERHRLLALVTTGIMILNLPVMKRTLMMGYDFWPQFGVLVVFLGILALQRSRYRPWMFLLVGGLSAIPVWFRDITTLLPVVVASFLMYTLRLQEGLSWRACIGRVTMLMVPILVSVTLLASYRYDTTGSFRPTRSTFWHSFMAGVGQFSNPYGLSNNDQSVWEFGRRINPNLTSSSLSEMYLLPDSPYEVTLKEIAGQFVQDHPIIFLRNFAYRVAIMIAPPFYVDGDFLPPSLASYVWPFGVVLLPLWFVGMLELRRGMPFVFGLVVSIYAYFFLAFGWFYVVGRVILPFMFMSTLVWLAGSVAIVRWVRGRGPLLALRVSAGPRDSTPQLNNDGTND